MAQKVTAQIGTEHFKTVLTNERHEIIADEPTDHAGADLGFSPGELLCSALAACTCITLRMYADRKGWPLVEVRAEVQLDRDKENNTSLFQRQIWLIGNLDQTQRERLLAIANLCPIHKTLTGPIEISTTFAQLET